MREKLTAVLPRWRARFFRTAPRPAETALLETLDAAAWPAPKPQH